MYAVSNAYKTAMKNPVKRYKLRGTIGSTDFTEEDILEGSLSIANQISDGDDLNLGSVYTGELRCTFIGIDVDEKADITIEEGLHIGNDTFEYVPMGVFRVSEANVMRSGTEVVAYDRMTFFDKKCAIDASTGTMYDFAVLACNACGVTLGMTEQEMQALPNGQNTMVLIANNDIDTWRDLIYWIAQTMACVATINRTGQLVFRPFGNTSIDTIQATHRDTSSVFSNFSTRYSGISVVNVEDQTTSYYGMPIDNDLTYNLGSNPFLQSGSSQGIENMRRAVLLGLQNIDYTPFEARTMAGAAYDLLDVVTQSTGLAGSGKTGCIMYFEWHYNGLYYMKCVGSNPDLAGAQSKTDKNLKGLMNNIKSEQIYYYTYENARQIDIGDSEEETIIDIKFITLSVATIIFQAEINLTAETTVDGIEYNDAVATVSYYVNNSEITEYHPAQTFVDGNHILHLLYFLRLETSQLHHFVVKMELAGGDVSIPVGNIKASIYGQGLAATVDWDGTLTFEDAQDRILSAQEIGVLAYAEEITSSLTEPETKAINVVQGYIQADAEMQIRPVTDTFNAYLTYTGRLDAVNNLPTYDATAVDIVDGAFVIKSGAQVPQSLIKTLIDTQITIAAIQNVQMTLSNCSFRFSPDGTNWYVLSNGVWVTLTTGMSANDVANITSAQWLALVVSGRLDIEIIMTDANSTVTELSIDYLEDIA